MTTTIIRFTMMRYGFVILTAIAALGFGCAAPRDHKSGGQPVNAASKVKIQYDLDRYLNIRGHAFTGFSYDGEYAFYLSAVTGTAQLWRISTAGGWPEQVTFFSDRVQFAAPSPTENWLLVGRDSGGNENTQLFLVKSDGSVIKNLTNAPDVKHDFGGWSWDGKKIAFASNARTQKDVLKWRDNKKEGTAAGDEPPTSNDVYVMEIGGATNCVHQAAPGELYDSAGFSPDGERLLLTRESGSVDNDLFILNLKTKQLQHLTPHKDQTNYSADWSADGNSLWAVHNEGREYYGLFKWDLVNNRREAVRTPNAEVERVVASHDGRWLAVGTAKNGGREFELINTETLKGRTLPLGTGIPDSIQFLDKTSTIGYVLNGPANPSDTYIFDHSTNQTRRLTNAFLAGISRDSFVEPQAITYTSFDGLKIEALLWRPEGKGPHPTIVDFHGGPESQHRPSFSSLTQYFVSRGYAIFQPNVRGSSGYGRKFIRADDVRDREHSVADGKAGVEWLKANGIADPKRIACYGGSYGGYMVLASLTL